MTTNNFKFNRVKTLGIEPKNEEKVFIKIPLETGDFWEKEYFQNDLIGNVINDFKTENHVDIPKDYIMDWNCKNKSLKMTDQIKTLLVNEIPTICFNPKMKKKPLIIQEDDIIPQVVGKPFNNPFEIFLFKKSNKILKIQTYDENIINNLGLNDYNSSSAYCNGNNQLFISGGETENNEIINKLWQIDLINNNSLNDPFIISPKKNHSMIFIPPEYVFIVGGNDKKTFYFDSENHEIYEWAELNIERFEPALQRVGNTLYCFDNINKLNNEQLSFEKTDLSSKNPEWNLIYPKMDLSLSNQKLPQKFFGVAKDGDNSIIFLGGTMDNYTEESKLLNYKYNPNNNTIELSNIPYHDYNFKEKTFLSYNKNIDYILPDFNRQCPEVVFYVKNKSKVQKVDYKPNIIIKTENVLRGANRPLLDSKYDFNMPIISIPDPSPELFTNINNNIKLKSQSKYDNPFSLKDIHEPSFQEYDYDLNHKIEQPPPFKEPEIEVNNEDQRLSIDIPINFNESKNEKNIVDLKEEKKNNVEENEKKINLKYIPKPPIQNFQERYSKEYNIPRFHYSVNDPGNELNISSKGKIYSSYIPTEPSKIKYSHADFNIKSSTLEKEDLILPNYNQSINVGIDRGNVYQGKYAISSRDIKLNGDLNDNWTTPNIHMPQSSNVKLRSINLNSPKYKITGNAPEINVNGPKINTTFGNKNLKGPNSSFEMSGIIPGTKSPRLIVKGPEYNLKNQTINSPDYKISGNIEGVNLNSPKIELKSPNRNLKGLTINSPKYNINGSIPGVNMKSPKLSSPDYYLTGSIPGRSLNPPKIELNSPNIDLKGTKINSPDYCLSGSIPGVNIKSPKNNNSNYKLSGNIPGLTVNSPKINFQTENINGPNYKLKTDIPGLEINSPKIDIKSPNLDLKGQEYNLSGNVPGSNINGLKVSLNEAKKEYVMEGIIPGSKLYKPNLRINNPNINLRGPNLNSPNFNLNNNIQGDHIPEIKLKSQNINLKGPKVDVPDYSLKGDIPGMEINIPKVDINSPKVDLKGPEYDLNGNMKKININNPKIDMSSGKIYLKNRNIKSPEYKLKGEIPGIHAKNQNFFESGIIPSYRNRSPNLEIRNYKITEPNVKISTIEPNINIKESYNNNIKLSMNRSRGNSPGKRNFHGSVNDPNYSEYFELKGSRRPLFSSQIDDRELSPKINKNKFLFGDNKIIDEKDVILQEPFNMNSQFFLKGQNQQNRKSINLTVNKIEIQPEPNYNVIKLPEKNIDIQSPKIEINPGEINMENNLNLQHEENNIKFDKNVNLDGINIKMNNKLEDIDNINIKTEKEKDENIINIKMPKIEINNDTSLNNKLPNIEIEQPKLESNINLKNRGPTTLRFEPILEEDNKININISNKNNISKSGSLSIEESNSRVISGSERGNFKRKNKGLPTVGNKSNNFTTSKIDVAGKLDVNNIDVNNMKSANVGINGVKIGERIIE